MKLEHPTYLLPCIFVTLFSNWVFIDLIKNEMEKNSRFLVAVFINKWMNGFSLSSSLPLVSSWMFAVNWIDYFPLYNNAEAVQHDRNCTTRIFCCAVKRLSPARCVCQWATHWINSDRDRLGTISLPGVRSCLDQKNPAMTKKWNGEPLALTVGMQCRH